MRNVKVVKKIKIKISFSIAFLPKNLFFYEIKRTTLVEPGRP